jgi:hypothetical protein
VALGWTTRWAIHGISGEAYESIHELAEFDLLEVNEGHVFHLRDGKVTEFWNASTDMYAYDELIG